MSGYRRVRTAGEDDAFHELASFRMSLVILMALKLFDRQLLGKLAKLRIELRKTNAQPKANNKQMKMKNRNTKFEGDMVPTRFESQKNT